MPWSERGRSAAYGALVVAAGLNLRDPITGVSATLGAVAEHYRLSAVGVATLSSLPVLLFAAGAPLAPLLERRLGAERSLLALSALLTAAVALRPFGVPALFLGSIAAGAAISGLSVLTPQLIRERLGAHIGLWSGVFSTSFGLSAALGAALTVPLLAATGSLPTALALWAVPAGVLAILAAVVAAAAARNPAPAVSARAAGRAPAASPPGRFRVTLPLLELTAFFGCQALVFFAVTTWLPTFYEDRGLPPAHAAGLLAWLSVAGLPASLLVSLVAARLRRQHLLVAAVSALSALGLAAVAWTPVPLAPLAVAVLGFAQGAAFGLAVALIVLKAPPGSPVAPFSAFVQGAGYAIAAGGPLLLGLLRSAGAPWDAGIGALLAVVLVQAISGWAAGRRVVRAADPRPRRRPLDTSISNH